MKKVLYTLMAFILLLIFIPTVFAANKVEIESAELIEKSNNTVELATPSTKNLDISFDLSFIEVGDYAKYKVIINNSTKEEYEIARDTNFKKSDHLKYEFEFAKDDNIIKPNSKLTMYITVKYNNELGLDEYKDGMYQEINNMSISLSTDSPINPETRDILIKTAIILFTVTLAIIVSYKTNNKKIINITIIAILLTPIIVYAIEKIQINIQTKVTIEEKRHIMMPRYTKDDHPESQRPYQIQQRKFWQYYQRIRTITFEKHIEKPEGYLYEFDVSDKQDKSIMAYILEDEEYIGNYNLYIMADGYIYANPNSSYIFDDFTYLTKINNIEYFKTPLVITMKKMFRNPLVLEGLDLTHFNTSNVTDMSYMFHVDGHYYSSLLRELDLSSFDTSNVTNMEGMFYSNNDLKSINLSSFDTSNVTHMSSMFAGCESLEKLDLKNFDTKNVVDMHNMFDNNTKLESIDLSSFNTSNVTDMSYMFHGCMSIINLDLTNFNTSKVTDMSDMFSNCTKLTKLNVTSFNTSKVKDMGAMFSGCAFTNIDLSKFDTSNVTDMIAMFSNNPNLISLDLSNFNTIKVENMTTMFYNCNALISINLSSFDTSNVTNMRAMFSQCKSLSSLDVSNFNTSKVTDMSNMFSGLKSLTSLDVSNFDTSKVTTMEMMFNSMENITTLDLSNFNTPNLTDMRYMFADCINLTSMDLSSFDTTNVTNISGLFDWDENIVSADLSSFNTSNVTNMSVAFRGNINLEVIYVGNEWSTVNVTKSINMFSGCKKLRNYNSSSVSAANANTSSTGYLTLKV